MTSQDAQVRGVYSQSGPGPGCQKCEGCEDLFGTDEIDIDNFKFPAVTAPPGTNQAKQRRMKEVFKNLVSLVVGYSHIMDTTNVGRLIRAGQGIFTAVVALSEGK